MEANHCKLVTGTQNRHWTQPLAFVKIEVLFQRSKPERIAMVLTTVASNAETQNKQNDKLSSDWASACLASNVNTRLSSNCGV